MGGVTDSTVLSTGHKFPAGRTSGSMLYVYSLGVELNLLREQCLVLVRRPAFHPDGDSFLSYPRGRSHAQSSSAARCMWRDVSGVSSDRARIAKGSGRLGREGKKGAGSLLGLGLSVRGEVVEMNSLVKGLGDLA